MLRNLAALAVGGALLTGAAAAQPTTASARPFASLYLRGAYDSVVTVAGAGTAGAPTAPAAAYYLVRALTDRGRPGVAVERVGALRAHVDVAPAVAMAQEALGQLDAAAVSWRAALPGADSLRARVEDLRLQRARGSDDLVLARLEALVSAVEMRGEPRTASDAHALAIAARLLGRTNPDRFKAALRYYDRALSLDSTRLDARVELGEMFLEKFNFADARSTLTAVLDVNPRHPRALAAIIRLNAAEGRVVAIDPLSLLLAVNPASADAHSIAARRLIDAEQYDAAVTAAQRGLGTDSTAPGPWTAIAAARWLAHDTTGHRIALERAHQRLSGSAQAEVELAHVSARNRLYADAVRFARAGIARDPRDARALALLGINLMRIGQPVEARTMLDRAFALDPYDVWVKNTLDLLDAYKDARTIATAHFDFVIEPRDADVMALYAAPLAEEAYATLTARYGWAPTERVRVEFFRSHADFSVRAVGLAGLGALGVAFGNVLAIDAPPARDRGEFNWAAVLWHEFTHTITLGATENRVPRWVSEGLSVHEERRARPAWGGGVTPRLIAAYTAGRLQPVSRLNDGFVHPRYDEEVILSYALSAFVFEMLEERNGMRGIRELLSGYREGGRTPQLMAQVYGLSPAAMDSTFDRWFRVRFTREFAAVRGETRTAPDGDVRTEMAGPLREALTTAAAAMEQGAWRQVIAPAERAVTLFPSFTDPGSGYHFLVAAHTALGDTAAAMRSLAAITAGNGDAVDEHLALARHQLAMRDTVAALAMFDAASVIDPFDSAVQARLADLAATQGAWPLAIRARRAVLALGPSDRAEAHFRLAQALAGANQLPDARREVLRALDLAPSFEAAQDLLLSLRSALKVP